MVQYTAARTDQAELMRSTHLRNIVMHAFIRIISLAPVRPREFAPRIGDLP
jgi:hypothetical protein